MSAEQQLYVSPCSPFALGGVEPPSSPQAEMETLRRLVSERMTAAVDDILGVFIKTVARYREQIDRQRRQLDSLRSEEGRWNHTGRSGDTEVKLTNAVYTSRQCTWPTFGTPF